MNANPESVVLCFGDSNTYGQRPDEYDKGRLPADQRWTGRLQSLLGDKVAIIEEGSTAAPIYSRACSATNRSTPWCSCSAPTT
jgi:lysophospholipase L1-like esterase